MLLHGAGALGVGARRQGWLPRGQFASAHGTSAHPHLQVPLIVAERVLLAALRSAGIMLPNPFRILITLACQNQVRAVGNTSALGCC